MLWLLAGACVSEPEPEVRYVQVSTERSDDAWMLVLDDMQNAVDRGAAAGIAMAVVVDGKVAHSGAVGTAWEGGSVPLTDETVMRWNSISKLHTAILALQLVDEGKLDLHEPVDEVLDISIPAPYRNTDVTLHHLMTHQSGLPDHWFTSCETELKDYWQGSTESLLAEPGTLYNYSNTGWSLAGRLIEKRGKGDFMELMRERVLEPAGMTTATFDVDEVVEGGLYSIGYDSGDFYTPDLHDCPWVRPAGWLHGSVLDLARSVEMQLGTGEGIVSTVHLDAMRSQVNTYNDVGASYGYGLTSWNYGGVTVTGHGGSGVGHRSYLLMVPERDFGVVVVTNDRDHSPYKWALRATTEFLDLPPEEPEAYLSDPDDWPSYEGTYQDDINVGTFQVIVNSDGRLSIRFLDGDGVWYRLYQDARDQFFYILDGWNYVRFVPGDDGETRYVANRYWVGQKTDDLAAESELTSDEVMLRVSQGALEAPMDQGEHW
jgi:CubicO group peptidase (beta-lactamase class C family)